MDKFWIKIALIFLGALTVVCLQGSGHELYGGFPGYSPMLFNGSPMEQAMPATGLGLGPGNISPGSLPNHGMVSQGLPPHYNGAYHPGYMQQNIQVSTPSPNLDGISHQKFNLFGI